MPWWIDAVVPNVAQSGHSFNGALRYYLHDKGADTTERVTWTATRNIGIDNVEIARRVMIATANRSDELKRAAGIKAGRKATDGPVYAYSLAWHPEEAGKIDRAEMMKAAEASLMALGAEGHQAIIVAHHDEPQPHVHVIVNRVHPDTGKMLATGNDHHRLSSWALAYREARGEHLKYCPQRAKNAETRAQYPDQAQRRQFAQDKAAKQKLMRSFEWSADPSKRSGAAIKARSDAMKTRHGQEWKDLTASYQNEREKIWNERRDFKAIKAQHRAETRPLWSAFGKQQARERHEWTRDERTFAGVVNNALKAVASQQIERGRQKGFLKAVFWHTVHKDLRAAAFDKMQAKEKADFAERVDAPLNAILAADKSETSARINVARANYAERKTALKEKQAGERAQIREAWKLHFAFRDAARRRPYNGGGDRRQSQPARSGAASTARQSTPSHDRAAPERAKGAQSVSELREAYGKEGSERTRNRDRTHSRRKERTRSRTRDNKSGPS